ASRRQRRPATPGNSGGRYLMDAITGAAALAGWGLVPEPTVPPSLARFPDGAHYRIEIPSVEGPAVLRAVIETAGPRPRPTARGSPDGCAAPGSSVTRSTTSSARPSWASGDS